MKQCPAVQEVHVSLGIMSQATVQYSIFLVISQKNLLNLISNGIISLIKLQIFPSPAVVGT